MILPGVSGAFILLLLGKYEFIIQALTGGDLATITIFGLGCILGLISFSRVLSWIFANYRYQAIALLAGFMLGSLNKVWPWKKVTSFRLDANGDQVPAFDKSVLPWHYVADTGKDPLVLQAILMMALGIFIVVFIEKIASRLKT
jgi:putative membrane protein